MDNSEIMTVEEVAEYLRVSERTVYDWAQKGEIPCGKLGTAWRFKRSDVMEWVDRSLGSKKTKSAPRPIPLGNLLVPERVIRLECTSKVEALNALIDTLATAPQIRDREELANGIFQREDLMSTGIGLGIAVPHVRLASINDIVMAAAVCANGITDYDSLDGAPVRLIFMVAAGQDQHAQYIKLLAMLSSRLKDEAMRDALFSAIDGGPEAFCATLMHGSH